MSAARLLSPTPENIALCAHSLRKGEIGGMPTETVYGLAGNGFNPSALALIFETKRRPTFDPLILHLAQAWLTEVAGESALEMLHRRDLVDPQGLNARTRTKIEDLIRSFWPGPLTLVLPKMPAVPDLATSGLARVALRMPRHPLAQALIEASDRPLAAPSANRFGRISPTRARHVIEELGEGIEWVLDGGSCEIGVESTVIAWQGGEGFVLLRPGGLPRSEIEAVLGDPLMDGKSAENARLSPGQLDSHYAPAKKLHLLSAPLAKLSDTQLESELKSVLAAQSKPIGLLSLGGDPQAIASRLQRLSGAASVVRVLSRDGSLSESARNLFSELRALDASSAEILFAEPVLDPDGLGPAIQDRLNRASVK